MTKIVFEGTEGGRTEVTRVQTPLDQRGDETLGGWDALVAVLVAQAKARGIIVTQIKEKFGGLRFYYDVPEGRRDEVLDAQFQRMVESAGLLSFFTCEVCGKPGVRRSNGWIKVLCDEHHEQREQQLKHGHWEP